jgi:hypothetical protein
MTGHEPIRPTWRCGTCDEDWPCSPRRAGYLDEYRDARVMLLLALARYFGEAVDDLPEVPASSLYVRFLAWLPV